jgi:hypothetical protein
MRRIMYIEWKSGSKPRPGRIGWVETSKAGRSFYYQGMRLLKTKSGYKYNCIDVETGDHYWVSGPKKNGKDTLHGGMVEIDDDARVEYWTSIRGAPELSKHARFRA